MVSYTEKERAVYIRTHTYVHTYIRIYIHAWSKGTDKGVGKCARATSK